MDTQSNSLTVRKSGRHLLNWLALIIAVVTLCLTVVGCKGNKELESVTCGWEESDEPDGYVCMTVRYTNSDGKIATGDIVIQLRPDVAPETVRNFENLVSCGFYDGLTFHRIYSGFMIQGGDPEGNGMGGSGTNIKGEFPANGVNNMLSHKRGVISMARSVNSYDSASSQFFIVHQDSTFLDGQYAAFGEVIFGMETVDGIAGTEVVSNSSGEKSKPVTAPVILKAYFVASPVKSTADETNVYISETTNSTTSKTEPATRDNEESDKPFKYVTMTVQYVDANGEQQTGDIVIKLRPDVAPITVKNFEDLVSSGFYDGLTFHRVYSGFMIQGGDPKGNGTGGSDQNIKGEFSANGVKNPLSHKRGVISMARASDPDSASSQFFICHADSTFLDGQYAAFGEVISGMDTVDGIAGTEVVMGNGEKSKPVTAPVILKATLSETDPTKN